MSRKHIIISYDIRDSNRLRRVASLLLDYAERVQYSVYEAKLTPLELQRLKDKLNAELQADDELVVHSVCRDCERRIKRIGVQNAPVDDAFFIL